MSTRNSCRYQGDSNRLRSLTRPSPLSSLPWIVAIGIPARFVTGDTGGTCEACDTYDTESAVPLIGYEARADETGVVESARYDDEPDKRREKRKSKDVNHEKIWHILLAIQNRMFIRHSEAFYVAVVRC